MYFFPFPMWWWCFLSRNTSVGLLFHIACFGGLVTGESFFHTEGGDASKAWAATTKIWLLRVTLDGMHLSGRLTGPCTPAGKLTPFSVFHKQKTKAFNTVLGLLVPKTQGLGTKWPHLMSIQCNSKHTLQIQS